MVIRGRAGEHVRHRAGPGVQNDSPHPTAIRNQVLLEKLGAVYLRDLIDIPKKKLVGPGKLSDHGVGQLRAAVIRAGGVARADWFVPPEDL